MGQGAAERQAIVDRLLGDPPVVHTMYTDEGPRLGVLSTDESCYRLIARLAHRGSRTLETGSGLSTALFAALGTEHRCVTPGAIEAERLRSYLEERAIPADRVIFDIGSSHLALPQLETELDIVLLDGAHGFPMPILDWFYAGALLRPGGTLIVDDLQLPAVRVLIQFLDHDPRWEPIERTEKWAAFRRLSAGSLAEEWVAQPFYFVHPPGARAFVRRAINKARRELGKIHQIVTTGS